MRTCKICGCTDNRACPGGCEWILDDVDICSGCWEVDERAFTIECEWFFERHRMVRMDLSLPTLISLIGAVQLACRHPEFKGSDTQLHVELFLRELISKLPREMVNVRAVFAKGWNAQCDVRPELRPGVRSE